MTVELSPETQKLLEATLKSGSYATADQAVYEALQALHGTAFEPLDESVLDAIDASEEQIARGDYLEWKDAREKIRQMFKK